MRFKYRTFGCVWALVIAMAAVSADAQLQPPNNNNYNNNPPDRRQQVEDRLREILSVEKDDEWAVLEPRLERVLGLQSRMGAAGGVGASLGRQFRSFRFDVDSPNIDEYQRFRQDLNRALANPASSSSDIRTLIRSLREARAQVMVELNAARAELIPFLTSRQEAILIQMGALE